MHGWLQGICDIPGQIVGHFVYVCDYFLRQRGHNLGPREDEEVFLNGRSSLDAWLDLEILLISFAYQRPKLLRGAL